MATRQHGIVARHQLLEIGLSASAIKRWLAASHLHQLHRGVYAVGHALLTDEGRWLAAVLACGPNAALSHGPAGQLLGIVPRRERFALHVSLPGRGRRGPTGILTHSPRCLSRRDMTIRNRIPVTTPTRTVWDLATVLTPLRTRRAFEQAEKLELLDRERLQSLLEASPSRKGSGVIRELLGERSLPLAATRTRLEEILLETCRDHGLPLPAVNVPLLGYEVDFLWPAAKLVVEVDGGERLNRAQRDKDNERDAVLARAGYLVRRYSWGALGDGAAVAAELAAILAERIRR
ncbi:MAG TPA: type IV toxin-antitoxin system AbiEi family antitoxin domain-containing protein [Solirubrobacterales bacterium]|nr:type IV toxin-antitoxin system AbiEi family antitoxin domain-containing protein [Solirubrobacterales bacterium]